MKPLMDEYYKRYSFSNSIDKHVIIVIIEKQYSMSAWTYKIGIRIICNT